MAKTPATGSPELQNPLELVRVGLEAVKGGAPAVLVWAAGSVIALTAVTISSLFAAQKPILAVGTLAFGTLAVGLLSWLATKNRTSFLLQYRWRVVQQPIRNEKVIDALSKELSNVLTAARDAFEAAIPGVNDQVRANIFLADFRRAQQGVAFELRMPAQFRNRMLEASEWNIAFQPGQGATGEVFVVGQPVLTTKRLHGVEGEEEKFNPIIATELKAIISLPIFDNEHANVIAVLNIDVCGDAVVEDGHLPQVYDRIKGSSSFKKVSDLLNQLDKAWLTIGLDAA